MFLYRINQRRSPVWTRHVVVPRLRPVPSPRHEPYRIHGTFTLEERHDGPHTPDPGVLFVVHLALLQRRLERAFAQRLLQLCETYRRCIDDLVPRPRLRVLRGVFYALDAHDKDVVLPRVLVAFLDAKAAVARLAYDRSEALQELAHLLIDLDVRRPRTGVVDVALELVDFVLQGHRFAELGVALAHFLMELPVGFLASNTLFLLGGKATNAGMNGA